MKEMPDNSIDIIITSPPYNFGLDYKEAEDQDAIHCNGVGTTTLVAEKLNRRHIGIDISENYCKTAEERIKEYKKQSKLDDFVR